MRILSEPLSVTELQEQLASANARVAHYQQEVRRLIEAEKLKAQELAVAYQQLQSFAKDLKSTFEAERRRTKELENSYYDTLLRLVHASQYKDEESGAHVRRLSHYSKAVARHLDLGETEAELIFAAAPMHDVGKIGVPDAVLLKNTSLNREEWQVMYRHPSMGATLLMGSNSILLERAREIALTHHERWDGTGYPRGLKKEEISLSGRIVMLTDQYDALRSKRSYKPPFSHDKTCDVILNGDGRTSPFHFDPQLLTAFRDLHRVFEAIFTRITD